MDAPEFRKWPLKIFKNFFLKSENFHAEKHQRYGYMKIFTFEKKFFENFQGPFSKFGGIHKFRHGGRP